MWRKPNLNYICSLFLTSLSGFMFIPVSHLSSCIKLQHSEKPKGAVLVSDYHCIYIFIFGSKLFVVKLYCMPFLGNDRKRVVLPMFFYCLIYQGSFKVMPDGLTRLE